MPKLTDTQLVILSAAAERDDGVALPLPKSIKADEKATTSALKRLLKAGLLAERPATRDGAGGARPRTASASRSRSPMPAAQRLATTRAPDEALPGGER